MDYFYNFFNKWKIKVIILTCGCHGYLIINKLKSIQNFKVTNDYWRGTLFKTCPIL